MDNLPNLPPSLRLDEEGRIAQDVDCLGCQYNLRSLLPNANCPECGKPVIDSLETDQLCLADPRWLKQLIDGLDLVLISVISLVVVPIVFGLILTISKMLFSGINSGGWVGDVVALIMILQFLVLFILGHWRFTAPQPNAQLHNTSDKHRRIVRLTFVLCTVVFLIWRPGLQKGPVQMALSGVLLVVLGVAILTYARKLALRMPDARLARAVSCMLWTWVVYVVIAYSLRYLRFYQNDIYNSLCPDVMSKVCYFISQRAKDGVVFLVAIGMLLLIVYSSKLSKILRQIEQ